MVCKHARGSSLGAGLGLLSMLIAVGVIIYVFSRMASTDATGTGNGPNMFNAPDYARAVTQQAYDQQKSQLDAALNAANNTSPPNQNGAGR